MITKNYGKAIYAVIANVETSLVNTSGETTSSSGTYLRTALSTPGTMQSSTTIGTLYLQVGNGTTDPTVNDYCIESQLTDAVTISSVNKGVLASGNTQYTFVLSNDMDSDLTITELCLFIYFNTYNTYNANTAMILREVIDPITLRPGQAYTVTFEISYC